jgi:ribosome-associated toxin RatA of RatAB toxin-antitoxin module
MRLLKLAVISIILLFALWTLLSLLIPSQVRISKATNISARPAAVWALVNDSAQWHRWHPWFGDSSTVLEKVRFNWQERSDSFAHVVLQHPGVRDLDNNFRIYRLSGNDSLTVQWYIDFKLKWYPWEKFSSLFFESSYGQMMEQGLKGMKGEAEGISNTE